MSDGTQVWSNNYDTVDVDIFEVQSDIAARVAAALGVIAEPGGPPPTRSLEAYSYYMKGNKYVSRGPEFDNLRWASDMYQQAIALDGSFALAYARRSITDTEMYFENMDLHEGRLATAWVAARTALELQPDLPEGHIALGQLYYYNDHDFDRALAEFAIVERSQPNNADLFKLKAYVMRRQGKLEEAAQYQEKSIALNPRTAIGRGAMCWTYIRLRWADEAKRRCEAAVALFPDNGGFYDNLAWHYLLTDGNTQRAREVLEAGPDHFDRFDAHISWVDLDILDRNYEEALRNTSRTPDSLAFHRQRAEIFRLMGQIHESRGHYESARVLVESQIAEEPDHPGLKSTLGLIYAGLGWKVEAIRQGQLAVDLRPISDDYTYGYISLKRLAMIYTMVGEYDLAISKLEFVLPGPGDVTVPLLRLDPRWDPLRGDVRFQRLLTEHENL